MSCGILRSNSFILNFSAVICMLHHSFHNPTQAGTVPQPLQGCSLWLPSPHEAPPVQPKSGTEAAAEKPVARCLARTCRKLRWPCMERFSEIISGPKIPGQVTCKLIPPIPAAKTSASRQSHPHASPHAQRRFEMRFSSSFRSSDNNESASAKLKSFISVNF